MGEVIDFRVKAADEPAVPHLSGKARCLACRNEWVAVTPVGTWTLLCPSCGCDGHMIGEVVTDGDQWKCACGWLHFRIDKLGAYCPNCGVRQAW